MRVKRQTFRPDQEYSNREYIRKKWPKFDHIVIDLLSNSVRLTHICLIMEQIQVFHNNVSTVKFVGTNACNSVRWPNTFGHPGSSIPNRI